MGACDLESMTHSRPLLLVHLFIDVKLPISRRKCMQIYFLQDRKNDIFKTTNDKQEESFRKSGEIHDP